MPEEQPIVFKCESITNFFHLDRKLLPFSFFENTCVHFLVTATGGNAISFTGIMAFYE